MSKLNFQVLMSEEVEPPKFTEFEEATIRVLQELLAQGSLAKWFWGDDPRKKMLDEMVSVGILTMRRCSKRGRVYEPMRMDP